MSGGWLVRLDAKSRQEKGEVIFRCPEGCLVAIDDALHGPVVGIRLALLVVEELPDFGNLLVCLAQDGGSIGKFPVGSPRDGEEGDAVCE